MRSCHTKASSIVRSTARCLLTKQCLDLLLRDMTDSHGVLGRRRQGGRVRTSMSESGRLPSWYCCSRVISFAMYFWQNFATSLRARTRPVSALHCMPGRTVAVLWAAAAASLEVSQPCRNTQSALPAQLHGVLVLYPEPYENIAATPYVWRSTSRSSKPVCGLCFSHFQRR